MQRPPFLCVNSEGIKRGGVANSRQRGRLTSTNPQLSDKKKTVLSPKGALDIKRDWQLTVGGNMTSNLTNGQYKGYTADY
jgi:hypothetical protein